MPDPLIVAIGFAVGVLIGLTGMGGGSLTTPLLILVAGVRPAIAVGTDLVFAAATKWLGAAIHARQGTADLRLALWVGLGSAPFSVLGALLVSKAGHSADRLVTRSLGITLIVVAVLVLLKGSRRAFRKHDGRSEVRPHHAVLLGTFVGLLVGITSVGSGTLVVVALMILAPGLSSARIVGTDLVQAAVLTSVAGIAHAGLGHVDLGLALGLVAGSLPGVAIGSRLASRAPDFLMRPLLATVVATVGVRLV